MNERCPYCGIPVGNMSEDASNDEMACNTCYEIAEAAESDTRGANQLWQQQQQQ